MSKKRKTEIKPIVEWLLQIGSGVSPINAGMSSDLDGSAEKTVLANDFEQFIKTINKGDTKSAIQNIDYIQDVKAFFVMMEKPSKSDIQFIRRDFGSVTIGRQLTRGFYKFARDYYVLAISLTAAPESVSAPDMRGFAAFAWYFRELDLMDAVPHLTLGEGSFWGAMSLVTQLALEKRTRELFLQRKHLLEQLAGMIQFEKETTGHLGDMYQTYLETPEWQDRRKRKLEQSGCRCEHISKVGDVEIRCTNRNALQVHHIEYKHITDEWDKDLIVLCNIHHADIHNKPRKL